MLTLIFLVKFITVDVKGLNFLVSGTNISFVNAHCKHKNASKQVEKLFDISQDDLSTSKVIALNMLCTSQFTLEFVSWEHSILTPAVFFNEYVSSKLSLLYLDNESPPPRPGYRSIYNS